MREKGWYVVNMGSCCCNTDLLWLQQHCSDNARRKNKKKEKDEQLYPPLPCPVQPARSRPWPWHWEKIWTDPHSWLCLLPRGMRCNGELWHVRERRRKRRGGEIAWPGLTGASWGFQRMLTHPLSVDLQTNRKRRGNIGQWLSETIGLTFKFYGFLIESRTI